MCCQSYSYKIFCELYFRLVKNASLVTFFQNFQKYFKESEMNFIYIFTAIYSISLYPHSKDRVFFLVINKFDVRYTILGFFCFLKIGKKFYECRHFFLHLVREFISIHTVFLQSYLSQQNKNLVVYIIVYQNSIAKSRKHSIITKVSVIRGSHQQIIRYSPKPLNDSEVIHHSIPLFQIHLYVWLQIVV